MATKSKTKVNMSTKKTLCFQIVMSLKKANKRFDFVVSAKQGQINCVNIVTCQLNFVKRVVSDKACQLILVKSGLTCPTKVTHNVRAWRSASNRIPSSLAY